MHLSEQHCLASITPILLSNEEINQYLKELPLWESSIIPSNKQNCITRSLKFKDYEQTLQFINKIAPIINKENHHPLITFGYNTCKIEFFTHTVSGVTLFDLICAAHIEKLVSTMNL